MKTNIDVLAHVLATVIWADGEYSEIEKEVVAEIAEAIECDSSLLQKAVGDAVASLENADEKTANDFLQKAAAQVAQGEEKVVYETVLEMALVDGVIARGEVETVLEIANVLGINSTDAVLLLLDMVSDGECYTVEI